MRNYLLLTFLLAGMAGCSSGSSDADMAHLPDMSKAMTQPDMTGMMGMADMTMAASPDMTSIPLGPMLTVNNTISWCTVIVTINGTPTTFGTSSMTFAANAGSTVMLQADPKPTFLAVKWTGVTTMNGNMATYDMTNAASQMVTACCPLPDGSGC